MVNQSSNDGELRVLELFAGAGGEILAGELLGHKTICAVEYNAYARSVLLARQNDGTLPPFPIWDDVRTFDGNPWRGIIDVVSGGFPCQDISVAGKGAGIEGERSGLWREMARIIRQVRPSFVVVENSPMLTSRGLGKVLRDLAEMGFDAEWGCISAADTGASHLRERIWIVANSNRKGLSRWISKKLTCVPKTAETYEGSGSSRGNAAQKQWRAWPIEPGLDRVAHGVAHRVDRIKAIGNGQVPRVAATAWEILK